MTQHLCCLPIAGLILALAVPHSASAATIRLFVVAGQSNAVGASADGEDLAPPLHLPQLDVRFWFEEGPLGSKNNPSLRLTSGNAFIDLQPQSDPNHRAFDDEIDKGFGPEISLGRDLADALTHDVAIVKFAFNGASLADDWNPAIQTSLYPQMVAEVNAARISLVNASHTVIISGFFWMQGESDATITANANAYEANLTAFIQRVRTDLGVADLPFVLGRINVNIDASVFSVTEANRDTVRTAQQNVADADPNTYMVDTDDLPLNAADGLHFVAAGEVTLGQRFAAVINIPSITVSGRVANAGGTGVADVTMNGLPGNPVTNANGEYTATGNVPFTATATPTKAGLVFTPASRTYTNVLADQTNQDYVASPALTSLAVSGPATVTEAGMANYTAEATYSDSSTKDITLTATWSVSSGPGSVQANGTYTAPATVLADTPATIRAEYSENGITRSATRNITVQNTIRILASISLNGDPTVNEGETKSYTATATYDDASTQNVTNAATWSISNGPGDLPSAGQYTAPVDLTTDTPVTLLADYTQGGVTRSNTLTITVLNTIRVLTALSIDGPDTVDEAGSANYSATATYDDASTQDVTANATWLVPAGPGTFPNPGEFAAPANVTTDTPATIQADYSEGGVNTSANKDITINNSLRILSGVTVDGQNVVNEGEEAEYTVTATYDDATTADVTSVATWVVVLGAGDFPQPGTYAAPAVIADLAARVRARYTESGITLSGAKDLTVKNVRVLLTGLAIDGPASTPEGVAVQYLAVASFDDGSTKNVTATADWSITSGPGSFGGAGQYVPPAAVSANTAVAIEAEYSDHGQTRFATWDLTVTDVPAPMTWYRDADNDNYGDPSDTMVAVVQPTGYIALAGDCDDGEPAVNPGTLEVCGDGIDNDCDGNSDGADSDCPCPDADNDGVCNTDDNCPTLFNPSQANRDGDNFGDLCDPDADGDGFFAPGDDPGGQPLPGPADCNDSLSGVNPEEDEDCDDGIDNDCDGDIDDDDSECDSAPRPRGALCAPAMMPAVLAMFGGLLVLSLARRRLG